MDLGARLRWALTHAGKTQQDLARHLGISKSAVSQQINGETKEISAKNLFRAARYLEVEPEWLGTGKGPRTPLERLAADGVDLEGKDVREIVRRIATLSTQSRNALRSFLESMT